MKRYLLLSVISFLTFLQLSCRSSRYITEQYIKNNIEEHNPGNSSNIRTYSIFKGNTANAGRYIELTGYKLNSRKGLVIGADRSYITKKATGRTAVYAETETYIDYIHLSFEQARSILANYKVLQDFTKKEKPRSSEEVYHDYTVSEECFISFRKSGNGDGSGIEYVNLWVKGEKYRLSTRQLAAKLIKFSEY